MLNGLGTLLPIGGVCKLLSVPSLLFPIGGSVRWKNNVRVIGVFIEYRRGNYRASVSLRCFSSNYCPSMKVAVPTHRTSCCNVVRLI